MRKTDLKRVTTGVVITVVVVLILLGFIRARLIHHRETPEHNHHDAALSLEKGYARDHGGVHEHIRTGPGLS
jgi:hypothetical protein